MTPLAAEAVVNAAEREAELRELLRQSLEWLMYERGDGSRPDGEFDLYDRICAAIAKGKSK